jgi:hypothetical protein
MALSSAFLAGALLLLTAPLAAQCNPDGGWQGVTAAPSIAGTPIGPSDVLGVPALLFAGSIAGSPAPFYLWDGVGEHPLAAGPDRTIYFASGAIPYESPSGPVIAVRGFFEIAGVPTVLAFWDGIDWQLPGAPVQGVLHTFATIPGAFGDELWIGGEVSLIGGVLYAGAIARFDGSVWSEPAQVSGSVKKMAVAHEPGGSVLYLSGYIFAIDGAPFGNIARYDGTTWNPLGGGTVGEIEEMSVVDGTLGPELWVAGDLDQIGGVVVADLARLRGGAWEALPHPGDPWPFAPTRFIEVPTEQGTRVAPLTIHPFVPLYFGYLGWDESAGAWVELTANPSGAVRIEGSPLVPDGVYRRSATSPLLQNWCHGPEYPYGRGDTNNDGAINIADVIHLLGVLLQGIPMGNCPARFDSNGEGNVNIGDAVFLLGALFPQSSPNIIPPPALPNCGLDPFPSGIFCLEPQGGC